MRRAIIGALKRAVEVRPNYETTNAVRSAVRRDVVGGADRYRWASGGPAGAPEDTALTISPSGGVFVSYKNSSSGAGSAAEARQVFGRTLELLREHAAAHRKPRYTWTADERPARPLSVAPRARGLGDFYECQIKRNPIPGYTLVRDGDDFALVRAD